MLKSNLTPQNKDSDDLYAQHNIKNMTYDLKIYICNAAWKTLKLSPIYQVSSLVSTCIWHAFHTVLEINEYVLLKLHKNLIVIRTSGLSIDHSILLN